MTFLRPRFNKPKIPIDLMNAYEWESILNENRSLKGGESLTMYIKFKNKIDTRLSFDEQVNNKQLHQIIILYMRNLKRKISTKAIRPCKGQRNCVKIKMVRDESYVMHGLNVTRPSPFDAKILWKSCGWSMFNGVFYLRLPRNPYPHMTC